MSESKSLLARLLSKENISVQHGNYTTAFFDVQNRILGLPLWKDDDKDLHDMLVGHEVGHALYTPAEGWACMQTTDDKDQRVPGDYLNVVEDIRIERMIQETYPGLARSFKKGYHHLNDTDFFGIRGRDVNTMGLMDRINLKAKLRDLIDVEFSDIEQPFVDQAFRANTWDEVVEAARALYEFVRQNPESQPQQTDSANQSQEGQQQQESDMVDPTPAGDDNHNQEEESNESNSSEDQSGDSSSDAQDSSEDAEPGTESNTAESGGTEEEPTDLNEVETYRNAQQNAEELLERADDGSLPVVLRGMTREQMKDIIVPFEKVRDSRNTRRKRLLEDEHYVRRFAELDEQYKEFLVETKRVVSVMAKEFELRKAAYQYSRASTARSGALDLQRLHEYKTNDDIFRRVTTLADAKSHGMVMLIDNSASMHDARGPVISQVLNLAMFCKRVNIPFDVYSFTNIPSNVEQWHSEVEGGDLLEHGEVMMTHMLSSSFSRKEYDEAYRQLFYLSRNGNLTEGKYDAMSGTPLNDILTGMHLILKDFKNRYQIQRPIFTLLTDGDSNTLRVSRMTRLSAHAERRRGIRILLDESRNVVKPRGRSAYDVVAITTSLLESLKKEVPGLVNLGFFVANTGNDFRTAVYRAHQSFCDTEVRNARKIANRNKFVSYDNTLGHDRFFILRAINANDLNASTEEFEVSDKAKRGEIARAFKKYARSKKGNRVLATQFAEIIS